MSLKWIIPTKRLLIISTLVVLSALSASVGTAKPALATTCYGGAVGFSVYIPTDDNRVLPQASNPNWHYYTTTSRCRDINLKLTSGGAISACVIFIRHTNTCNYWTDFYPGDSWKTIATDVLDGTDFVVLLDFGSGSYKGLVAY
jgi:hypothetical protein